MVLLHAILFFAQLLCYIYTFIFLFIPLYANLLILRFDRCICSSSASSYDPATFTLIDIVSVEGLGALVLQLSARTLSVGSDARAAGPVL